MSRYLKKEDVLQFLDIGDDMRQVFRQPFTKAVYQNEIVRQFQEKILTEEDLSIAIFLYTYKFATIEQLYRGVKTERTFEKFKSRVEKLVNGRVVNKFILTYAPEMDRILKDDAFTVYCLDIGGHHLLTHFWHNDSVLDWLYITNIVPSESVAQTLLVTEVGLSFLENKPEGFKYFKPAPELRIAKKMLIPSFELCLEKDGRTVYFLGEVVRKEDVRTVFRDRSQKWNYLLKTFAWKKYYDTGTGQEPVMLVITNDDESALRTSSVLFDVAEIEKFRLSTPERLKNPLGSPDAFLKYIPDGTPQLALTAIRNFEPAEKKQ